MTPAPAATGAAAGGGVRRCLSAVALGAGAGAHVQADGLLPGPGRAGRPRRSAAPSRARRCCAARARRVASWLLLVAGQSVVHMALAVTAGHRGDPVAGASPGAAGPGRHRARAAAPSSTSPTPRAWATTAAA